MDGSIKGTKSIAKAALVLRTLSVFTANGATLNEISKLADMPKSTSHRILSALLAEQLVERVPGSQNYRLGSDIVAFGIALKESFDLKSHARPTLESLACDLNLACYLGVRSGYDLLCRDRCVPPDFSGKLVMQINDRWPLGVGSMGLAVLAFLPERERKKIVAFNCRRSDVLSALDQESIERSVLSTRLRGYAKRSMHSAEKVTGIALPVFDRRGYPVASVCVVFPTESLDKQGLVTVVSRLRVAATELARIVEEERMSPYEAESWRYALKNSSRAGSRRPATPS